jgi:hypothetical protein
MLARLVAGVEGRIVASRAESHAEVRRELAEARKRIPAVAWKLPLEELDLPGRIHNLLLDNNIETVGDVLLTLDRGDEIFLNYRGFGDKMLETLKEYVAVYELPEDETSVVEVAAEEVVLESEQEVVEETVPAEAAAEVEEEEAVSEAVEEEQFLEAIEKLGEEFVEEEQEEEEEEVSLADEPAEEEPEPLADIDDLSKSIFEPEPKPAQKKKKPSIVVVTPSDNVEEDEEDDEKASRRGRRLVYDEKVGEVVVKRKRKRGRGRPEWEEELDVDDF